MASLNWPVGQKLKHRNYTHRKSMEAQMEAVGCQDDGGRRGFLKIVADGMILPV